MQLNYFVLIAVMMLCRLPRAWGSDEVLASRPPMGYNTYHDIGTMPDEATIRARADAMVSSGMKDLGYEYLNIDDGWMDSRRDGNGDLQPNPSRFPSGMRALTDYVHAKGLKIGIYLTAGLRTYQDLPGSLGYEDKDANQIAGWGFDFLKYDYRTLSPTELWPGEVEPPRDARLENIRMSEALRKNRYGRRILFSMCEHGRSSPWTWAKDYAQLWRTTTDIKDVFEGEFQGGWSFNRIVDESAARVNHQSGIGHWNDYDMLVVGLHGKHEWMGPGMSDREYRSHFSLWALLGAPLIHGVDPDHMSQETRDTLTHSEIIAIDQDPLGLPGKRVVHDEAKQYDIWVKPLQGDAWAVGLYNRSDDAAPRFITLHWSDLGVDKNTEMHARDLWNRNYLGYFSDSITREVQSHEVVVLKLNRR